MNLEVNYNYLQEMHDELTQAFIAYQHRLDFPMPNAG